MIIGLHGKARAGKDSVCNLMRKHSYGKVVRRAFADQLKLSAYRLFKPDATVEEALEWANSMKTQGYVDMMHDSGRGAHVTGREFLQRYGTESHRDIFGRDFWVDCALPQWDGMGHTENGIFQIDPRSDYVVFTDVRFENEATRIAQWGGRVWEVVRDEVDHGDIHSSEQRLPERFITKTFYNNGTLESLEHEVIETLQTVRRN